MDDILISSLSTLDSEFQPNELAYLALTTKIELPVRDRWAFRLYRELSDGYTVSREWRRTDLAILSHNGPKALIELKAMYTFDAALDPEGIGGFCDAMESDEHKALKLADGSGAIYTVLLATHPKGQVDRELERVVKYRQGLNRALKIHGSEEEVARLAEHAVDSRLEGKYVIAKGVLSGGEAFGVATDVYYWLVRAE